MRLKKGLILFVVISVSGCAAAPVKIDRKSKLAPVRKAYTGYNDCLKQNLKAYLKPKAVPKKIADAVAIKCEPRLVDYKLAVREFYAKGLDPKMEGYEDLLRTKPESHAGRVREKGKRATITRVREVRKASVNQPNEIDRKAAPTL